MDAVTCSPDIVYPAPRISVWHPSCCTTQQPWCSSILPFHFPFKRSRKNHEGPLLLTLKTDLISAEEDGTQLTNRAAPFSCLMLVQQHRTGWCFKAVSYLCALTHARKHQSQPSSPCGWPYWSTFHAVVHGKFVPALDCPRLLPQANIRISFMSIFGQEVPKDRIYSPLYTALISFYPLHPICQLFPLPPSTCPPPSRGLTCFLQFFPKHSHEIRWRG